MVVLDLDPHRLERLDRLVAQLGGGVERGHREVAALVERLGPVRVLEEEVLELGTDVERVEAHVLHPLERLLEDVARVAVVRNPLGPASMFWDMTSETAAAHTSSPHSR